MMIFYPYWDFPVLFLPFLILRAGRLRSLDLELGLLAIVTRLFERDFFLSYTSKSLAMFESPRFLKISAGSSFVLLN